MFYVSKISIELWVSLEANNLNSYIQRLELIHFKVINFCMSTYDFDVFILFVMFNVTSKKIHGNVDIMSCLGQEQSFELQLKMNG